MIVHSNCKNKDSYLLLTNTMLLSAMYFGYHCKILWEVVPSCCFPFLTIQAFSKFVWLLSPLTLPLHVEISRLINSVVLSLFWLEWPIFLHWAWLSSSFFSCLFAAKIFFLFIFSLAHDWIFSVSFDSSFLSTRSLNIQDLNLKNFFSKYIIHLSDLTKSFDFKTIQI